MKRHRYTLWIAALGAIAGCQSAPSSASLDPSLALRGPYQLRLSLDRPQAAPGELVHATLEFENTGRDTLWVPTRSELFFGYEQRSATGVSGGQEYRSTCSGLRYVAVKPGTTLKVEKGFVVPAMCGEIRVFVTVKPEVAAPLEVTRAP